MENEGGVVAFVATPRFGRIVERVGFVKSVCDVKETLIFSKAVLGCSLRYEIITKEKETEKDMHVS